MNKNLSPPPALILLLWIPLLFICQVSLFAQKRIEAVPTSFIFDLNDLTLISLTQKYLPSLDMPRILEEDTKDDQNGLPPRFGVPIDVSYSLNNSGAWTILPNGDRVWRLKIKCKEAVSINLLYDAFWLPKGARFHLYTEDKAQILGAYTTENNRGSIDNPGKFTTGLLFNEEIILELYEPKDFKDTSIISIDKVVHGYKELSALASSASGYGNSGPCQVNVNCPEGQNWQNEKKGVAMILVNGSRVCTGSLVNNTDTNYKPYFLTADHCIGSLDANGNTDASHYSFYWNYESNSCSNSSNYTPQSTSGAILKANNPNSDFALFELSESPLSSGINVYFNGWDRTTSPVQGGVGIHHPRGDFKKIATHIVTPINVNTNSYWRVNWKATANGHSVTEAGSSGSPLFTNNKRIIGQLFGGDDIDCSDPANDPGIYGKFSVSWNGTSPQRRLKDWLDPNNLNPQYINGLDPIEVQVQNNVVCAGNSTVFTIQNAAPPYIWTSSSNITITSATNGSSVTVQAVNSSVSGPGFVKVTHNNGTETINIWVGRPSVSVELTPHATIPEKLVDVDLVNNSYSVQKQGITNSEWQKTGGNGNLHVYSFYSGMGSGPINSYWYIDVKVKLTNSCGTATTVFTVEPPPPTLEKVAPIPNAADEQFSLDFSSLPADTYQINIYDQYSNIHYSEQTSNTKKTIETLHIPEGLYIIQIYDSKGNIETKNLIINH